MNLLQALQGALRPASSLAPLPARPALLLGAGGWLGAAMLSQLLAAGFVRVGAWVEQSERWRGSSHRGVLALDRAALGRADPNWAGACAFVVLERAGLTGQRDAIFGVPQPETLLELARALRSLGASRLVVVLPHQSGTLPAALRHGFADGSEQALSELGFEQLLLVRSSRDAMADASDAGWLQRLAGLWWAQLRWMLPDSERPLRSVALARVVVAAVRVLADQAGSVYVLTQELASQAAHAPEGIEACLRQGWKL